MYVYVYVCIYIYTYIYICQQQDCYTFQVFWLFGVYKIIYVYIYIYMFFYRKSVADLYIFCMHEVLFKIITQILGFIGIYSVFGVYYLYTSAWAQAEE